jgi:hypothetical protein
MSPERFVKGESERSRRPVLRKNPIGVMRLRFQADIRGAAHQLQVSS